MKLCDLKLREGFIGFEPSLVLASRNIRAACREKQILRSAYPTNDDSFAGPQGCSAQDDTAVLE